MRGMTSMTSWYSPSSSPSLSAISGSLSPSVNLASSSLCSCRAWCRPSQSTGLCSLMLLAYSGMSFWLVLHTDSEETVCMLTVRIWECGKAGSRFRTLDSDGPAHLVPLMEDYEYSGQGSVLIHTTCLVSKCDSSRHWWH